MNNQPKMVTMTLFVFIAYSIGFIYTVYIVGLYQERYVFALQILGALYVSFMISMLITPFIRKIIK